MTKIDVTYNRAYVVFLSVVAAIGGILYGYDTAVISGTIDIVTKQFSLDTMSKGWYVGSALVGSIMIYTPNVYRFPQSIISGKSTMKYSASIRQNTQIGERGIRCE